ncbi:MAG: cell division protein FtsA [Gammaproteobacteria bacterium]|nr:cell division protein FtsA [Gammaproteobacteria bacterium]
MKEQNIVAAIDIGTAHIVAALAKVSAQGDIIPIALAEVPSKGVKKGGVVNIPYVQQMVDMVLDELQENGSYHIYSIVASLSGVSVIGYNADGVVDIRGTQITEHNIQQVVAEAKDVSSLDGRHLLHILRQSFIVDNQTGIDNPLDLMGEKLSVRVHIISAAKMAYYNLLQTFSHRDVDIEQVIASSFASAIASTSQEEKQLGVCVLDIGAGTTDISVIHQGVVKHTEVVPVGGDLITNDVAFFMRTTNEIAEQVKREINVGSSYAPNEQIEVKGLSDVSRKFSRRDVGQVIIDRYEQIFEIVFDKLRRAGVEDMFPAGIVLCGGCAEQMGLESFIQQKTGVPVRKANIVMSLKDRTIEGSRFATIMGLFVSSYKEDYTRSMTNNEKIGIIKRLASIFAPLRKHF